jgi:stage II sporulation protein P
MMFVVGKGEKFDDKPDFKTNYSFANSINQQLSAMDDGLVRNICIKTGRYNQHIGELSCLIEIGHNRNTLEEAKNSAELFAKALSKVVSVDNG